MKEKEALFQHLRTIQLKYSRLYTHILSQADLSLPQYALLNQLDSSGPLPMTEISGRLHISKPAVTNLVDRLEKKKFLKRTPHPRDRRIYLLELSPKGKTIARKIQNYVLAFLFKTFDQFSVKERKTVQRFYACLSEIMDEALQTSHSK